MDYLFEVLFYASISTGLFLFRNPDKNFKTVIAVSLFVTLVSEIIFNIDETLGTLLWIVSASVTLAFYFLRVWKRKWNVIDGVKLVVIALLVTHPMPFFFVTRIHGTTFALIYQIAIPLAAVVYTYDRWILKPEPMNRKFITVLVAQTLVLLVALVYAFVQAGIAKEQEELAKENAGKAIEQARRAESARREMEVRLEACAKKNQ